MTHIVLLRSALSEKLLTPGKKPPTKSHRSKHSIRRLKPQAPGKRWMSSSRLEDLKRITGYERLADVERCLVAQGVRFFRGRRGIWTTVDLVNAAGGIERAVAAGDEPYNPDDLAA